MMIIRFLNLKRAAADRHLDHTGVLSGLAGKNRRLRTMLRIVFLFVVTGFPFSALPVDYSPLVKHREVRVGMFPLPGYHDYNGEELVGGYGFDYLQKLANYTTWKFSFTPRKYDWHLMLDMLESGKIDMVSSVHKTLDRETKFAFSKYPIGYSTTILTIKAGSTRFLYGNYAGWSGMRVGMLKKNSQNDRFTDFAKRKKFTWTPVYFENGESLHQALMSGESIDASVTSDLRKITDESILEKFDVSPFYIVVRKNDQALLKEINDAQEELGKNLPVLTTDLRRKYYSAKRNDQISYTVDERTFITRMNEQRKEFIAVINPDRRPMSYVKNGEYRGLLKDIADEIIRRSGLTVRFLLTKTREEYYRACVDEKVDIVFDLRNDNLLAMKTGLHLTSPYFESPAAIIHRKERSGCFRSFATVEFSNMPELLKCQFSPDVKIVSFSTLDEAIDAVRSGRCEATYQHTKTVEEAFLKDLSGQLAIQYMPSLTTVYSAGIRDSRNPLLFSIIEKATASIDDAFISRTNLLYDAKFVPHNVLEMAMHQHLVLFVVIVLGVFLLLAALLWFALRSRIRLRDEEIYLRMTLESMHDGLIATDCSGKIKMINPVAERMTGVSLENAVNKSIETVFKVLDPRTDTIQESLIRRAVLTNAPIEITESAMLVASDGTHDRRIRYSAFPIFNKNKQTIGVLLVFRDVTDEYRRQEEVKAALSHWNAVSKIARIHRSYFNFKTGKYLVPVPDDIWPCQNNIAIPAKDWIYPDDLPEWQDGFDALISGKIRQVIMNFRVLRDGKLRFFREYLERDGDTDNVIGVVQDITSIKEIQKKQEAAMELWQTCINMVPFMMFIKSAKDFRYLQCNESFSNFFNKSPSEIVGMSDAELFDYDEELGKHFADRDKEVLAGGKLQVHHESGLDVRGRRHYVRTVKVPAHDVNGELIIICMSVDETDEYMQRIELQNLLENRDAAADLASVVVFQINYKTMVASGSKRLGEYWPIKDGKAQSADRTVFLEDVDVFKKAYQAIITGEKTEAKIQYRRMIANNVHYYSLYMRLDTTIPDTITGVIQDVTVITMEQRKSEALNNLFNAIANTIPALLFVKDADNDYRYLYANKQLGMFYNVPENDIVGKTERDFMLKEEADRISLSDREVMNTGKTIQCYELVRDKNGVDHRFSSIKIPSVNEFGHRILIQMTSDVTELQELSEVRKIVSNAFENLFFTENLEAGIGIILRQVCEFIGFSRGYVCCVNEEQNIVRHFASYLPAGCVSLFSNKKFNISEVSNQAWYKKIITSKQGDVLDCDFTKPEDCEVAREYFPLLLKKKERFDIRGVHVQYLAINGKPWGYVGFLTECSNPKKLSGNEKNLLNMASNIIELAVTRRRSFINLQNAMEEAKAAAAVKSQFLATMSHEIRTPLNAVIGFAELLQDGGLPQVTHDEYLKNISNAGNVLLSLINDILDLSKLSANKMEFVCLKTSILTLIEEMKVCFLPRCKEKNVRLICDVPADFPQVWVDASRIRQLLLNLIGNAVKFTDTGSITVTACFSRNTDKAGILKFIVSDTGIGISDADQRQLFQPFVQAKNVVGTSVGNKGTGLGLSICKKMLECMDGRIYVSSKLGKGTTFTAELHNVRFLDSTPDEKVKPVPPVGSIGNINLPSMSVLIVDDVLMNIKVLQAMLKKLGMDTEFALHAEEALSKMEKRKYDYVLTDLWMPEMNGVELARRVREKCHSSAMKIALITADAEGKEHFDYSVFDAVLTKPLSLLKLQNFLEGIKK